MTVPLGIEIAHVTHGYTPKQGAPVLALDDICLSIPPREFHALLGPSGCGKSTLLFLIGGFQKIQKGSIRTAHGEVRAPGPDRGIVFQNFALFPWKTVIENVRYGLEKKGLTGSEAEQRARHFISLVHLDGFERSYPAQLSGGMQQRAAIARTLAIDPDILLMDEPFGALDAQTRRIMQEELLTIWRATRKTVVFVTHDVAEAVFLADKISVMSARPGRITQVVEAAFNSREDADIHKSPEFNGLVEHVWQMVRHEVDDARSRRVVSPVA